MNTSKIYLRKIVESDVDTLYKWWTDGEIMQHVGFPNGLEITKNAIRTNIEQVSDDSERFMVCLQDTDEAIGEVHCDFVADDTVTIGLKICNTDFIGKGYGKATLALVNDYAFDIKNADKIVLSVLDTNVRAQNFYEKAGFTILETIENDWIAPDGVIHAAIYMELEKNNWKNITSIDQKEYWIKELNLTPHIEGGWYNQTFSSDVAINTRPTATSIYFMLSDDNFSAFHQLTADEMWYYHFGSAITIVAIDLEGELHEMHLGKDIQAGESLQVLVPKGWIFGSYVETGFSVVSCMVTPGFTYEDFLLPTRATLAKKYPQHTSIINKMTRVESK